ncbi:DUF2510 domain-containing protein [Agromyces albus]|uniref:DUF2510 domain-containing protein n=1 Tax=Agromyces albus TaxID=205332 RepID=UPI00277FDD35|nr:DUF2510 domain-containing protein [Agromyces albus]MDQ0575249.1 hypothetical protein [Agromyces albus]
MMQAPAGWYADPYDPKTFRYWDGAAWTGHVAPRHVPQQLQIGERQAERNDQKEAAALAKVAKRDEKAASRTAAVEARQQQVSEWQAAQEAAKAQKQAYANAAKAQRQAELEATEESALAYWADVRFVGEKVSAKAKQTIRAHGQESEQPWLMVGSGTAGVLAAFHDRVMIVKTGTMTSFMAGAFLGGRITTFPLVDITSIEFNGQWLTGVLEILTPSYQGTANKDYWRGTNRSRNADSNDPWTLSNTLPLLKVVYQQALPEINELRKRIVESKKTQVIVQSTRSVSVADELRKLAELHREGILDDAEYATAKGNLIAGG